MEKLTQRQWQIIDCIIDGNSSHIAIASALHVKEDTVKKHLKNIYGKTGVYCKADLAIMCLKDKIQNLEAQLSMR